MDTKNQKTNIIIKEIEFWKQNKMLPEQYCNYLLALYNQGSDEEERERNVGTPLLSVLVSVLIAALISVSLFVIYFTELSFVLQTAILTGFVVLLISLGIYYSNKEITSHLTYISAALLLLLYSVHAAEVIFLGSPLGTYGILFGNCLAWVLSGFYLRRIYFTIAGTAGTLILIVSIVI